MAAPVRGRHKRKNAKEEDMVVGGHEEVEGGSSGNSRDSTFVRALLKDWAMGMISAPRLQKLARHAYEDQKALLSSLGLSIDHISLDLKQLASLGPVAKILSMSNNRSSTSSARPAHPQLQHGAYRWLCRKPRPSGQQ